jgi:hypothetical protein
MSLINKLVLAFLLVTIVPLSAIIGVLHYTFLRHAEVTGIPLVHGHLVGALVTAGRGHDEPLANRQEVQ